MATAFSTVVPFPQSAGTGFQTDRSMGKYDLSNVYCFSSFQARRTVDTAVDIINQADPSLIFAAMILRRLTVDQRVSVLNDVAHARRRGVEIAEDMMLAVKLEDDSRYLP